MSEIETFFRFCPECGRRFHIKLVSKKMTLLKKETFQQKRVVASPMGGMQYGSKWEGTIPTPTVVEETVPVTVNVEDFQYSYKCKHCGHQWTENREERHKGA